MRLVIIGSPRTGSSRLGTLLGSHPEVLCNANILSFEKCLAARGLFHAAMEVEQSWPQR
jgi:hypothetical protein